MVTMRWTAGWTFLLLAPFAGSVAAVADEPLVFRHERPTFKHYTNDPRPDIWPYPIWNAWPEYRRTYNRPRYIGGWIAYKISPTSQEAMAWQENRAACRYDEKHEPPMYKRYFAPKPWEVLNTGARPDYPDRQSSRATSSMSPAGLNSPTIQEAEEIVTEAEITAEEAVELPNNMVPAPLAPSASDR